MFGTVTEHLAAKALASSTLKLCLDDVLTQGCQDEGTPSLKYVQGLWPFTTAGIRYQQQARLARCI